MSLADARSVLERAIAASIFPAAAFEIGRTGGALVSDALGRRTFEEGAAPATRETIFDLASLTKPIATTTIAMELLGTGALTLDARVGGFFDEWRGADREGVTVRDLLEHASGLPARLVDPPPDTRREFEHDICAIPLEYAPRTQSIYSDLGFILLGFILEKVGGAPLDAQFDRITVRPPELEQRRKPDTTDNIFLAFGVPAGARGLAAPTRPMDADPRRGRLLAGEVHDDYAAALGGVAGHAGLFATARGVGIFARAMMRAVRGEADVPPPFTPALVRTFVTKSTVPGSSRALGWDTMLPTSSCGEHMSASAFGHVGFTGTSLWIDPARDLYFVLLSNRVCSGGTLHDMRTVRRAFHDAIGSV